MKIAYLDLNYPDHEESYSLDPQKYGGGRIFASAAKDYLPDFHIFARYSAFQDVKSYEKIQNCHLMDWELQEGIRKGTIDLDKCSMFDGFDFFFHHHIDIKLKTNRPNACWSLGYREHLHPDNHHLFLYNEYQNPLVQSDKAGMYEVIIGKEAVSFEEREKEDFIFQCTRHTPCFGSIEVAKFCQKYEIKGVFAGPIDKDYNLMDYIDNKYTFYLGSISEADKIKYTKKARAYTFIHSWPTPFNLSWVEASRLGTPAIATPAGFFPSVINHGVNGFLITNMDNEFLNAWNGCKDLKQKDVYDAAEKYTTLNMVNSFEKNIKTVYENWNK